MMTVEQFLAENTRKLDASGVGTARLDIMVLLEDCLNKNRTHLLAHPDLILSSEQLKWLTSRVTRRAKHEPLAYIRGKSEFYGREFIINKNVLEPRPESETMIDMLLNTQNLSVQPAIVDIGTGSGALAITAKLELPQATVMGIDIDAKCLEVAKANANRYKTDIEFKKGSLLTPLTSNFQLVSPVFLLANLPYVPDHYQINEAAGAEPRIAIFGGEDGLDLYRRFFGQLDSFDRKPEAVFTESMPPQHDALADIAEQFGFKLAATDDFIQKFIRG
ncbi:MAG TPA: HemK/PrmC family methyltransferase [Candidatus Saccharimonadales bacterium]|nr:HemK/PrmC family methyltransferase [Candidatus Saccharimonadales bacterium]